MNSISLGIDTTVNVPLYPLLAVPTVLDVSCIFLVMITSPTDTLCGSSDLTVTVPPENVQLPMNLEFLLKS